MQAVLSLVACTPLCQAGGGVCACSVFHEARTHARTLAPSRMVEPMPMRQLSPMVHACTVAPWPAHGQAGRQAEDAAPCRVPITMPGRGCRGHAIKVRLRAQPSLPTGQA